MLLKSIKLNNIRSYLNQSIDFPLGSLLLSGDIGSGKSTILLAIEFALFGSKPSELPASSLLRHGKKEGFVELKFDMEGKEIIIKRTLKKGKDAIKQETGYIITDEMKKELSPVEMKAEVFDLLGYPKDLVSKGKDLIYRYTVYTPQEEMKRILMEDRDMRLNTLRKVFNIDRYKRIKENSSVFIRALKEKKREIEGFISDLEEKKKEKGGIDREISSLDEKIKEIAPKAEKAKKSVKEKKENILAFEKKTSELNRLKSSLDVLEAELRNLVNERARNNDIIGKLTKQIEILENELGKETIKEDKTIREKSNNIKKNMEKANEELDEIKKKINEFQFNKNISGDIIKKISEIEKCPLCLQDVEHEHKSSITERENKSLREAEENIGIYSEKEKELRAKLETFEKEKEELRKLENKIELLKLKIYNLKDKKEEKENIGKRQEQIKKNIGQINIKKSEINEKINGMKDIEEQYKKAKSDLDSSREEEKKLDLEKNSLEKEKESLSRIIAALEKEIRKKTEAKEKLGYFMEMQNWLEGYFVNLMGTMEKHVMLQVHREFDELFKEWFNILIEDEAISVRLDDEFTPVVEQNGYETSIESLSGGEKTSVALSYRLALNKVINDVVSGIKTKDILMLDEPTDGFSSEQLDKVRDILNQLNMKQIVIVSHESKIESFVDKVIRVEKREHVSTIA
ncbi:SMC family ATPase [Candidatus Woesearchaeota archaeon]|nr:SMC family ATPase [Candidatus Woesearchaeota archaeon]